MRAVRVRPNPGQLDLLTAFPAVDPHAVVVAPPAPQALKPPRREPAADAVGAAKDGGPAEDGGDWRAVLDFERDWSGTTVAKQRAVRERFAVSSARYHQLLDRALELPEALAYDPALVGRLRRVREVRRRKRFAARVEDG